LLPFEMMSLVSLITLPTHLALFSGSLVTDSTVFALV
jgi:hypothetical protein